MASPTMDLSLSRLWETLRDRQAWHAAAHGVMESQRVTQDLAAGQQQDTKYN